MTILVTGATGNIGRKVVDHLLAEGADRVRALTVDPARAALPDGVEVAVGFVGRPASLPAALDGVDRLYLAPSDHSASVLEHARAAGVRHVVDVSGPRGTWWEHVLEAVEASGLAWTHLFPGEFMENFLVWADHLRRGDVVRDAHPDSVSVAIAMDDIAAIAARALIEPGHEGRSYELTGPEPLTRRERVAVIAEVLGRPIRYEEVSGDEAIRVLADGFGGDDGAAWYLDLLASDDEPPLPDDKFARVMGRPATSFAAWVAAHAHGLG